MPERPLYRDPDRFCGSHDIYIVQMGIAAGRRYPPMPKPPADHRQRLGKSRSVAGVGVT
jgi:hypothetical protein